MGNSNSNEKRSYNEFLLNNHLYTNSSGYNGKNEKNDLMKEVMNMKDEQARMIAEINHLKEKNKKIETELTKIQTNYGQEIFNLLEYCSVLQKDIENIMNNQRIISEVLQTNLRKPP
jgi:predicted  nucleic acid-binding Zn-ribbon protein